jgi:hypothetical protein
MKTRAGWIRQIPTIAYKCEETRRTSFTRYGGVAYFFGDGFFGGWDLTLVSALGLLDAIVPLSLIIESEIHSQLSIALSQVVP